MSVSCRTMQVISVDVLSRGERSAGATNVASQPRRAGQRGRPFPSDLEAGGFGFAALAIASDWLIG